MAFVHESFLLQNETAQKLYHEYAGSTPIYDYHCHLPAELIAGDHQFSTITEAWLYGDHYKWRAMRAQGIDEDYITGNASDQEKFRKWGEVVPYCIRNPLYHWTALELKRYFNIDALLGPNTADDVYARCNELLNTPEFSTRNLLRKMNVGLICTTEDPLDDLLWHQQIRKDGFEIPVHTAYRPDKALGVDNPVQLNQWIDQLAKVSGVAIHSYSTFLGALQMRHDFFHQNGCRLSDYGVETVYAEPYTQVEIERIFQKFRDGLPLSLPEKWKYQSAALYDLARMDAAAGWVLQLHVGAIRNNNSQMFQKLGPDTGYDSIGDRNFAIPLARFLDRLDQDDHLPKTILYNLNPRDNATLVTMTGNFQDGRTPGKIQHGAAWWFLDQKQGMEDHLNTLSSLGLLSRFVGMLTDSRSFLSFPRHEYFRRILCNLIGSDVENGLLPSDLPWLGRIVQDLCFNNAKNYFDMECSE